MAKPIFRLLKTAEDVPISFYFKHYNTHIRDANGWAIYMYAAPITVTPVFYIVNKTTKQIYLRIFRP